MGITLETKCRGIDKDRNPILVEAETVLVSDIPEMRQAFTSGPELKTEYKRVVFCRYLGIYPDRDGWGKGWQCTAAKETRKLKGFLDQDETRKCIYLE